MSEPNLRVESHGPVMRLTLNRPEVHNALNDPLIAELTDAVEQAGSNRAVRALWIRGEGRSFCAGADLKHMEHIATQTRNENLQDARALQRLFAVLDACPAATLATVQGTALGGGAGLLTACDVVVAEGSALFGFTETRLGIAPAVISPFVIRRIGMGAARALFVTAERFDAAEALRIGLVHEVVPAADLHLAALRRIESILQCAPGAVARAKQLLRETTGRDPAGVAELTADCLADLRAGEEALEGLRAYLARRKAAWVEPVPEGLLHA